MWMRSTHVRAWCKPANKPQWLNKAFFEETY